MTKFILLYNGPATPAEEMTKEQIDKVMAGWGSWMEKVGNGIVDIGLPMNSKGRAVVDDGSEGTVTDLQGYTIIQAEDMDGAVALVDGHPFLSDKTGKFSVEVFELLPMPGM
ncbi:MAG TPA: YciI family protein [Candidatus Nanoarchaeia archaeon]|nr:YciI family protein [Candidatus Nanoarchaeia archaeon]